VTVAARGHVPVLLAETISALALQPGEMFIDCTAGLGGHAAAIAPMLGRDGRMLLIDADPANLERAAAHVRERVAPPAAATEPALRIGADALQVVAKHANFSMIEAIVQREGLVADGVLADLGVASSQLDDPVRGLSFTTDGPLDMRLDPTLVGTASHLVNDLPERALADLIFRYGEDPFARRIAARIVTERTQARIESTLRLAEVVRDAYGSRAQASRMHPATRTFMALRIAVNDELGALERLLEAIERGASAAATSALTWLAPGCRIGIISFHSLEDRMVKRAFRELARRGLASDLTKRPIEASEDECQRNPRSRSAKLRVLRLVGRC